jgi:peptidoglycan hydrolase-like protein with peptidoglycan-binding domain
VKVGVVTSLIIAALLWPAAAGAASSRVAALQVALRAHGAYAGSIDGIAGRATTTALQAFQARSRLAPDGVVGPATRKALGVLGSPTLGTRVLAAGARGFDVAALQFELESHGFPPGAVDGEYGAGTAEAVRRAQEHAGLPQDGIAGAATLAAVTASPQYARARLGRPVAGPTTARYGPRGTGFHTGIDIAAPYGTRVVAAAGGVVASVGVEAGSGLTVTIDHGEGLRTRYALLSSATAVPGMAIAAGEPVGRVGPAVLAQPRLHFEVTVRGAYVDPESVLSSAAAGAAALVIPRSIASTR